MNKTQDFTKGVIWKQLLFFFFPILIGSFFQQLYNTVDTIIVGQACGTNALAAVGSTGNLTNLVVNFYVGLSTGASVVIAQYYELIIKIRYIKQSILHICLLLLVELS